MPVKKTKQGAPEEGIAECFGVPQDRIAALIGKRGETRRKIERETGVKVEIDSETGEVSVIRFPDKDAVLGLKAVDIIKAIARGFTPQKAFKLLSDNIYLEIIDLSEAVGDSPRTMKRVRSRIIGTDGKARKYISRLASVDIVVYGKTVGILGDADGINLAKDAILKIVEGLPHSAVFRSLESRSRS
jgi:ribosomal RNA assembly protein